VGRVVEGVADCGGGGGDAAGDCFGS